MKAFEFQASINPESKLTVPSEVAGQITKEQPLRVILLVPEDDEDEDWNRFAMEQFLKGYDESDAIYDQLPPG